MTDNDTTNFTTAVENTSGAVAVPPLDISYEEDPAVLKQAATEDYSLHVVPRTWRASRLSLTMAWSSLATAMFWVIVCVAITQTVGVTNAIIGLILSTIAYGLICGLLAHHAIKTGTTVSLFSRSLFGYMGSALAPLLFGVTAVYYMVFEGSVIAYAFQAYFGGNIRMWYGIVILYTMPLAIGGVRVWLDKLNGVLFPVYCTGLVGTTIWAIVKYGYSNDWLHVPSAGGYSGPGIVLTFTFYMGVWIMMMYTWDFARFGREKNVNFVAHFSFGIPFYVFTLIVNGVFGMFIAGTIAIVGDLSEVGIVLSMVSMMGIWAVLFVWSGQTKINSANTYLASSNLESFFSRTFKIKLKRTWWVGIAGIAAFSMMQTDVLTYIARALGWQAVLITAWVGITCAVLLYRFLNREKFKHEKAEFEFRPGRVRYVSPGMFAWFAAAVVGLYLFEAGGSWGVTWGAIVTFIVAFGLQYALVAGTNKRVWLLSRPHDPRDEVDDMWEARARCHVCDRSYVVYEMDRDPSADQKAICAGCASESMTFYSACRAEHQEMEKATVRSRG